MAWKEIKTENTFWSPEEEGDEVIGKLVDKRPGIHGEVYDIELESGAICTIPTWAILRDRLAHVTIGTKVKIVYEGDITTGTGRTAKNFKVYVDG